MHKPHALAFGWLQVPGWHSWQKLAEAFENVPALHTMHVLLGVLLANIPLAHGMHCVDRELFAVPTEQLLHCEAPVALDTVPAAHATQDEL